MQKLPEVPVMKWDDAYAKKEPSRQKKEVCFFSVATSRVITPKSILLLMEGTTRLSLDDALANLSTSSNCLFYQQLKTPNNGLITESQLRHHITDLTTTTENTRFRHISQKCLIHC